MKIAGFWMESNEGMYHGILNYKRWWVNIIHLLLDADVMNIDSNKTHVLLFGALFQVQ